MYHRKQRSSHPINHLDFGSVAQWIEHPLCRQEFHMKTKSFPTKIKSVSVADSKKFIDELYSDPDIKLGDEESMGADPFAEFVYHLLGEYDKENYDPDTASDGFFEELYVDDKGVVNGIFVISFDDGTEANIKFRGFVSEENLSADGDPEMAYKFIVVTDVSW